MENRQDRAKNLFTFGYGNRSNYVQFEEYLVEHEIDLVVDVRLTPRAWTRTWYGDRIKSFCRLKKVRYVSEPRLGNTSKKKEWIPPSSEDAEDAVKKLSKMALKRNILFLCAELKFERCHRTEVAECVGKLSNKSVIHLV
jgi:uncharacterized protein (DUF488 family)